MKPKSGRDVQNQVTVMSSVEPPEERDNVIGPMKTVEDEIEEDNRRHDLAEGPYPKVLEQSSSLCLTAHEHQGPAEQKVHHHRVAPCDGEVGGNMAEP